MRCRCAPMCSTEGFSFFLLFDNARAAFPAKFLKVIFDSRFHQSSSGSRP